LRIIFAGTPDFAVPSLQALQGSNHDVVAVYTQPDRPAGRGRKLRASPIKILAQQYNLPIYQPVRLDLHAMAELTELKPDLIVVVAYGLILPLAVLAIPRYGCLNVHASLLPRWRGAAPIARALLAADKHTGICIMQMEEGLDTGSVLAMQSCLIQDHDTSASLHSKLATLGATQLLLTLEDLPAALAQTTPQDASQATYAHKLQKAEALIDWQQSADLLARQIRAFNPWPGSYTYVDPQTPLKIWQAKALTQQNDAVPGTIDTVSTSAFTVACGQGSLAIERAQLPGAKAMDVSTLIAAPRAWLKPGWVLGNTV
jgi:methionyl-tRNA formyltransferase